MKCRSKQIEIKLYFASSKCRLMQTVCIIVQSSTKLVSKHIQLASNVKRLQSYLMLTEKNDNFVQHSSKGRRFGIQLL
jgi:hypothetical protein